MYKLIKMYKIPLELSDRMDYLIFNGVFDTISTKTIKKGGKFVVDLFERCKRKKVTFYSCLLNCQYNFYRKHLGADFSKYVGSLMLNFYEADAFDDAFLLKWRNSEIDHILKQHFLYDEKLMEDFKNDSKDFLSWIARNAGVEEMSDIISGSGSDSGSDSDSDSDSGSDSDE